MTDGSARVRFSITEGLVEIEGSEAFVTAQLIKLEPLVAKILNNTSAHVKGDSSAPSKKVDTAAPDASSFSEYENVFALADGKVQILKDLPGANKSQKTVNAALLLAYANQLRQVPATSYESVRTLCAAHACLDSTNFSSALKSEKAYFLISGNSGAQYIALTIPGKKKAGEIAKSLNS
jgi:hypothetical protein